MSLIFLHSNWRESWFLRDELGELFLNFSPLGDAVRSTSHNMGLLFLFEAMIKDFSTLLFFSILFLLLTLFDELQYSILSNIMETEIITLMSFFPFSLFFLGHLEKYWRNETLTHHFCPSESYSVSVDHSRLNLLSSCVRCWNNWPILCTYLYIPAISNTFGVFFKLKTSFFRLIFCCNKSSSFDCNC